MDVPNQKAFHVLVHSSLWNYSQSASRVFPSDFIITPFPAYSPGYVSFVPSLIRDCLWVSRYVIFLLTLCFLAEGFRTRCHCTGSHCSGQLPCGLVSAYLLLFWVLSHISQPLYLSLFCPPRPSWAGSSYRQTWIHFRRFWPVQEPISWPEDRGCPPLPCPFSVSCHFRQMSQGFAGDAAESSHWKVGTFSDSRSSSHPTNRRTKWTSELVCSLTLQASKKP